MSGNRSLDEFAGAGAGESAGGEGADDGRVDDDEHDPGSAGTGGAATDHEGAVDGAGGAVEASDDSATERDAAAGAPGDVEAESGAPDPPASTYVWSPDGGTCAGCGETAAERWRDGDDLVCAGCKEW